MKAKCIKAVKIIVAVLALYVLVDLMFTSDEEKLMASIYSFKDAVSFEDSEIATVYLSEDFEFEYADMRLDYDQFIDGFKRFVPLEVSVHIDEDPIINIDKDLATATVPYRLHGRVAVMVTGSVGKAMEVPCEISWRKHKDQWRITNIKLLEIPGLPLASFLRR